MLYTFRLKNGLILQAFAPSLMQAAIALGVSNKKLGEFSSIRAGSKEND